MIDYRLMQDNDISEALRLWEPLDGIQLSGADKPAALASFLQKNAETCFAACCDSRLIGTILGGSDGRRGYIYHLAVAPAFQHQGVGRELLHRSLDALKQAGIQKCHIFVVRGNQQGLRFWETAGWVLREDVILMSKDL